MITVSLCMIVKNEEELLRRCLTSVSDLVDEIIIVDTGSTDNTKEIARSFTDKVYDFQWINDFSAARNFAFSKATKEYQFWLDADDVMIEHNRNLFLELKKTLSPEVDMVLFKYDYLVDKNDKALYTFYRERLCKRANNYKWNDPIHEYIQIQGNNLLSDVAVTHKRTSDSGNRNLKIYEEMLKNDVPFSARSLYYYARELRDHEMNSKAVEYFTKFLELKEGSIDDSVNACIEMGKILKKQNRLEDALKALFKSFEYNIPTAEACCEIGGIFQEQKNSRKAIFWYELIQTLKIPENYISTINLDSWSFIPNIELAVCYYKMGNIEKAIYYNGLAALSKPDHKSVLHNRKYFDSFIKN